MSSPDTEELATTPLPASPDEPTANRRGNFWRGLTGSLAAGMVVLASCVLVIAAICLFTGAPGPGLLMLIGHPVAAVLAVLAQRTADARNGRVAGFAGLGVVVSVAAALSLFWWN
ncbi:hypothetical protein [Amycolatopsis regifaucium]|uniref:Uncharacterized protein n=1 Tax=Amycolatopsis regifaucium TaxID=546365 RepID=A0A154MCS8_9PSEU|nr:hypothetical protein [Amycolatopsis regifaucium]KZB82398.1 hypothetical protein AVL48_10825 [Amycolatopsis regifaucium]OKA10205.1 hypothetical protein ATP06_0204725 [Amycolatopsis regifaucium]SFG91710.1 hypothetical protein SAMN04489731_101956 [Amycolatopsis regifaucium]